MKIFQGKDLNSLYIDIITSIMEDGEEIVKENRRIKELFTCLIKVENPKQGILIVEGRPYNPAFLGAETLWNLAGDTDIWISDYNKPYKSYFTDEKLYSGYGNRIFNWDKNTNQFDLVVKRLMEEPNTQHADITIFNPTYDLKNPKFVPCITKLKFRIRNKKLHMTSFMRAQDMWLGFPYDINLLLSIFQLMASKLEIEMGDYYHFCDVIRMYEKNFHQVKELKSIFTTCNNKIELNGICDFGKINFYRDIIKYLPNDTLELISKEPDYWQNGIKTCLAYNLLHQGKFEEARGVVDTITNCFKIQFDIWASHYHKFFFEHEASLTI